MVMRTTAWLLALVAEASSFSLGLQPATPPIRQCTSPVMMADEVPARWARVPHDQDGQAVADVPAQWARVPRGPSDIAYPKVDVSSAATQIMEMLDDDDADAKTDEITGSAEEVEHDPERPNTIRPLADIETWLEPPPPAPGMVANAAVDDIGTALGELGLALGLAAGNVALLCGKLAGKAILEGAIKGGRELGSLTTRSMAGEAKQETTMASPAALPAPSPEASRTVAPASFLEHVSSELHEALLVKLPATLQETLRAEKEHATMTVESEALKLVDMVEALPSTLARIAVVDPTNNAVDDAHTKLREARERRDLLQAQAKASVQRLRQRIGIDEPPPPPPPPPHFLGVLKIPPGWLPSPPPPPPPPPQVLGVFKIPPGWLPSPPPPPPPPPHFLGVFKIPPGWLPPPPPPPPPPGLSSRLEAWLASGAR